jgi:hypothetical protein
MSSLRDGGLGFLTLANIYKLSPMLQGILPDVAKTAAPTLLADKGYGSQRFQQLVHDHGFRPLIPTRSCIPPEQAVGELYAEDASLQRTRYVVDRTATSFQAFVDLARLVLGVRPLITADPSRNGTQRATPASGNRDDRGCACQQDLGVTPPVSRPVWLLALDRP